MAINPNTDFSSGAILLASQQNRFPRGVVAFTTSTTSSASITTEVATLTSSSFTAVANRYYKVTYYEPLLQVSVTPPGYVTARIRLTNVSGTVFQYSDIEPVISTGSDGIILNQVAIISTLSAGATTICGTLAASSNSLIAAGSAGAGARRFIMVEDIGPA